MATLFFDTPDDEAQRRTALFGGALLVFSPTPAFSVLGEFARSLIAEHFAPHEARHAQDTLSVEEFIAIVGPLKSTFTNHPRTKELMREFLAATGHDLSTTYFDVPRLRVVSAREYLTAGVGYAYKAHRDTWYAGPQCQVNWWAPLYDLEFAQSLVFYPGYFGRPFPNSSETFDYDDWKRNGRAAAASQITTDTRKHPLPLAVLSEHDETRIVMRADQSVVFSGAQLHATAPNTSDATRFSIDFRTVDTGDVRNGVGAANVDSKATGTTLGDFISAQDFTPMASELVEA
jgi:hypothetical protein